MTLAEAAPSPAPAGTDAPDLLPLTAAQQRYCRFLGEIGMGDGLALAIWGKGGRCGFIGFGLPRAALSASCT